MSTLIIAEAGVNHNGDLRTAFEMIDVAANAGADVVKFQTFSSEKLVTSFAEKADYQILNNSQGHSQLEMLKKLELSKSDHLELKNYCQYKNIEFLSTAFDLESIDFLAELGQNRFKIPSGEITNLQYLRMISKQNKQILLSTGMSDMEDIVNALNVIENSDNGLSCTTILHCTSQYPTPMEDVNLRAMLNIAETFKLPVGYSDHTLGTEVAVAAVALGATVIEKHFTLSREMLGPDHKASLEPAELLNLVSQVRNIEVALGSFEKVPTEVELKNRIASRKSLIALRSIKKGELLTENNVGAKRPGYGISPMELDNILNTRAVKNFDPDEIIEI